MLTGEQVTQARELLRWSIVDLAHWSGVGRRVILTFEVERQRPGAADVAKIKSALERAGVEFTEDEPPRLKAGGDQIQSVVPTMKKIGPAVPLNGADLARSCLTAARPPRQARDTMRR